MSSGLYGLRFRNDYGITKWLRRTNADGFTRCFVYASKRAARQGMKEAANITGVNTAQMSVREI